MKNNKLNIIRNLLMLPSVLGITVFLVIPYFYMIWRSFAYDKKLKLSIDNYKEVLNNESFILANKNTYLFLFLALLLMIVLSMLISYLIFEIVKKRKLLKIIILIPTLLPISTLIVVWKYIFDKHGLINKYVFSFGEEINWIDSKYALLILLIGFLWKNVGFSSLLLLTGMETIPGEILEACKIDGVSFGKKFYYIIFPAIDKYFIFIVIFGLMNALKINREIYLIAGEYPHKSIYMIHNLFNNWFINLDIDKLSAGAVIELVILLIPILCIFRIIEVKSQ